MEDIGHIDFDKFSLSCFGDEHVMVGLDDRVTIVQCQLLCLKEIIRVVKVDCGAPCFLLSVLVSTGGRVMSYENTLLRQALDTSLLGILCDTPCKIVHVFLEELPSGTKILGNIQFFVNFAGIITEFAAVSPSGSEGPLFLSRMELELVNLFA